MAEVGVAEPHHRSLAVRTWLQRRGCRRHDLPQRRGRAVGELEPGRPEQPDRGLAAGPLVQRRRAGPPHRCLVRSRPVLAPADAAAVHALRGRQHRPTAATTSARPTLGELRPERHGAPDRAGDQRLGPDERDPGLQLARRRPHVGAGSRRCRRTPRRSSSTTRSRSPPTRQPGSSTPSGIACRSRTPPTRPRRSPATRCSPARPTAAAPGSRRARSSTSPTTATTDARQPDRGARQRRAGQRLQPDRQRLCRWSPCSARPTAA